MDALRREDWLRTHDQREISLLDIARTCMRHWRALVLAPVVAGALGGGASFLVDPTYVSTARILPPQQSGGLGALGQQLGLLSSVLGAAGQLKNPADQYAALVQSRTVTDRLIERFDLRNVYEKRFIEDVRRGLSKRSRIAAGAKDGMITIEVEDTDRDRAADIANAYVDEVKSMMGSIAITEAAQRRVFFERELVSARTALADSEAKLKSSRISESTLMAEPRVALDEVARLKAAVTAAEVKAESMQGYMASGHPDLRQARQEVAALRAQMERAERNAPAGATRVDADYIARYRDFKYNEVLFELMAKQYELARLDEARDGTAIQVVDRAVPAERPDGPNRLLFAVAAAAAAFAVVVVAILLRDALRGSAPVGTQASGGARREREA